MLFKVHQRDDRKFWSWVRGLFGATCPSYITLASCIVVPRTGRHDCTLPRGHAGKHDDGVELKWGYGDNWLEGC